MTNIIYRWFGLPGVAAYIVSFAEALPLIWPHAKYAAFLLGFAACIAAMYTLKHFFDAWAEHLERKLKEKQ